MRRILSLSALVLIAVVALPRIPVAPWLHIYCPVEADAEDWSSVSDDGRRTSNSWFDRPSHFVENGRLFLRVQSTRSGLAWVWVDAPAWDAAAIEAFRVAHPDLESRWPEPGERGGGVRWLRE